MKKYRVVLSFKKSMIRNDIEIQRDFLNDLYALSCSKREELRTRIEELVAQSTGHADEIYDHYLDEFFVYDTKYVELSNNSQLVAAYSFLEFELKEIRNVVKKFLINPVLHNYVYDKKKSSAQNFRDEIYSMVNLDFLALEKTWQQIENFRRIRNLIAHNGGNLFLNASKTISDQPDYNLIESNRFLHLNLRSGDIFINDKQYVHDLIELIESFLKEFIEILLTISSEEVK